MSPKGRPEWEVQVYGKQLDAIDVDLVAQIVLMLGREMSEEVSEKNKGGNHEPDDTEQQDGSSGRQPAA